MRRAVQGTRSMPNKNKEYEYIKTTLYRLIEASNEELQPGEEGLIGKIVLDLVKKERALTRGGQLKKTSGAQSFIQG